jgi:hypothetical protein
VQLDEAPRDREPEACALTLLDADARLLELLEDPLAVFAGEMPGPASATMTSTSPSTRAEATTTRGATSVVLRSRNLGHANPSITLTFYAHPVRRGGHEERAAAVLEAAALGKGSAENGGGERRRPTTAPSSRASQFIPLRQPVTTSGDPVRTPVTPEVAGSSPVAPVSRSTRKSLIALSLEVPANR